MQPSGMLTRKEALLDAIGNMANGTSRAAELKRTAQSEEVRLLAEAVHFIGYGAQQAALAFTESRIDDLPKGM